MSDPPRLRDLPEGGFARDLLRNAAPTPAMRPDDALRLAPAVAKIATGASLPAALLANYGIHALVALGLLGVLGARALGPRAHTAPPRRCGCCRRPRRPRARACPRGAPIPLQRSWFRRPVAPPCVRRGRLRRPPRRGSRTPRRPPRLPSPARCRRRALPPRRRCRRLCSCPPPGSARAHRPLRPARPRSPRSSRSSAAPAPPSGSLPPRPWRCSAREPSASREDRCATTARRF